MSTDSIAGWVAGLQVGDSQAVQALWNAYFARLVALARIKLAGLPRTTADEEDVALSAFKSFCLSAERGRFPRIDDATDLWRILVSLTARKAIDRRRYETRQKRGAQAITAPELLGEVIGREPTPEFAAELAEELNLRLAQLPPDLREIAIAKSEGFTTDEIADKLQCAGRTVERRLQLIRRIWTEPHGESID